MAPSGQTSRRFPVGCSGGKTLPQLSQCPFAFLVVKQGCYGYYATRGSQSRDSRIISTHLQQEHRRKPDFETEIVVHGEGLPVIPQAASPNIKMVLSRFDGGYEASQGLLRPI